MKNYLELLYNLDISLSECCQEIIQMYFKALRNLQLNKKKCILNPHDSLSSLAKITILNAKCFHRKIATIEDALISIIYFENNLKVKFHYKVIYIKKNDNIDYNIFNTNDINNELLFSLPINNISFLLKKEVQYWLSNSLLNNCYDYTKTDLIKHLIHLLNL
ncbi:hypothetical protein K502DRAFT_353592 [Neoconidiobolus thromboides FSU 785]|nr:hypothetical protein K502DRAFT_353592 [Neoconidiobolus thromboides FSU 785]